jgi:D-glycero-D-manno-heptose 1,7-bisphosphate phosphatase
MLSPKMWTHLGDNGGTMIRAIFLDRDGVIGENRRDHVKSWDEFRFLPGVFEAFRALQQAGWPIFVVTNQAIVNRGMVHAHVIDDIHERMVREIEQHGGEIKDIRYCPHDSHEQCGCRKPRAGMLFDLAHQWRIDLTGSYMIGDAWTDIAAGFEAGCHTVLVRSGRGAEQLQLPEMYHVPAHFVADHLAHAVTWILQREHLLTSHVVEAQALPSTLELTQLHALPTTL